MKYNTTIILLLLSIGLYYTFTSGQYKEVKSLSALANQYQGVLKNVSKIIELRDNLLVTYAAIPEEEIVRINKVLPDNIDTVRLALDLDGLASRYGISIKEVKTTSDANGGTNIVLPQNAAPYDKATVTFRFVSNYQNFMRLLADVEKSLRIMEVKSIMFDSTDTGLYDYTVAVETYWLK